jgi:hypothetical protein
MIAQLGKVVMDTLHVKIVTLSTVGQRGMRLHQPAQSRVLLVAMKSAIMARFVLDTLRVVLLTQIFLSNRFTVVQHLRRRL